MIDDELIVFLKYENARLSCGNKWLVWDGDEWKVLENPHWTRVKTLYRGESLESALQELRRE